MPSGAPLDCFGILALAAACSSTGGGGGGGGPQAAICHNTCTARNDSSCGDGPGGPCAFGTDCADCGPRNPSSGPRTEVSSWPAQCLPKNLAPSVLWDGNGFSLDVRIEGSGLITSIDGKPCLALAPPVYDPAVTGGSVTDTCETLYACGSCLWKLGLTSQNSSVRNDQCGWWLTIESRGGVFWEGTRQPTCDAYDGAAGPGNRTSTLQCMEPGGGGSCSDCLSACTGLPSCCTGFGCLCCSKCSTGPC